MAGKMTSKKILVTGGFGFLGTTLVEELLREEGDSAIHIVDNLSTSPIQPDGFLEEIGNPSNLTYSVTTVQEFLRDTSMERFDEIYHLASVVGPAGVLPFAGKMVRSIVDDTYALMDAASRWKARLLDVSTSEIYGGGRSGFCSEEYEKIVPAATTIRLEYAVGKLAAETAIINTCAVSDLDAVIVRPFNIAGPRQSGKGGFVLPRFLVQALADEPITVFGDGKQVRAFTHVRDMCRGILLAMAKGRKGEAYNVGNPANRMTILELAQRVVQLTGTKSPIVFVDPKTIHGPHFAEANDKYPDARKAERELGWRAERGADAVIADALEYILRSRDGVPSSRRARPFRKTAPLVSICLPSYNRAHQLPETLETIFAQTLTDFEVLACDDGSTDSTPSILESVKDSRLRVFRNPKNLGLARTVNRMFSEADGKYVAIFHDHDLFDRRLLERCTGLLESHPDAAFAFAGVTIVDDDNKDIVTDICFPEGPVDRNSLRRWLIHNLACPIAQSGAVIRKEALNRFGYFEPRFGISADLDLWIRLNHHSFAVAAADSLVRARGRIIKSGTEDLIGGWRGLKVCREMRRKGCDLETEGRPVARLFARLRVELMHDWAEMRQGLSFWSRGEREFLVNWGAQERAGMSGAFSLYLKALAASTGIGQALGGLRRKVLKRA